MTKGNNDNMITENTKNSQNGKKKNKLVPIIAIVAVVLLVAVGVGAFFMLPSTGYYRAVLYTKLGFEEKAMSIVNKLSDSQQNDFLIVAKNKTIINNEDEQFVGVYDFDNDGNLLSESYSLSDTDNIKCVYEYDKHGNVIRGEYSTSDGESQKIVCKNELDDKGRIVKMTTSSDDSSEENTSTVEYKYDKKGNVIEKTSTTDSYEYVYTYEYDNKGNQIKCICDGALGNNYEETFKYSDDGKIIESESKQTGYSCTFTYVYDENGYLVEEIRVDSDDEKQVCYYENDKNGNPVKMRYEFDEGFGAAYEFSNYTIFYRPNKNNEIDTMY